MKIGDYNCFLVDDGTLDTVISVNNEQFRYDSEFASEYRDSNGVMTDDGFYDICQDAIDQYEEYMDLIEK